MVSKTLLTITARGNAIITELNRLYELVPSVFLNNAQDQPPVAQEQPSNYLIVDGRNEKKFTINDLICDFSYFKIQESFEAKIDSIEALKRADEEFCNNYIDILTRFYLTFESVQRYSSDLNNFVQEIQDNLHVGQSFDSLLSDIENRQLLCESYFLLGYMLLTIDNHFESSLREKIIVSYFRYSSYKSSPGSNLDETCNLMRSTGYLKKSSQLYSATCCGNSSGNQPIQHRRHHRPEGYPESFFERVRVNTSLVSLLVSKLLSVDIYNQTMVAFTHPDHRSTALATQASMLYVILFFCPNILHNQRSKMREITDKFFYDNWMTSIYMGELVNLIEAWNPYRAARESLIQLLELESTRALAEQFRSKFDRTSRQLRDYLKEGWLDEDRVLEHHARILTLIRESNVILRWFMLHSYTESDWQLKLTRCLHGLVSEIKPNDEDLYLFLQNLAELERKFLVSYEELLAKQVTMITASRLRAIETIDELIAIFSDPKPMRYIQPGSHSKLVSHLQELATDLRASSSDDGVAALKREVIISSINQVTLLQDQYSDGRNLQVVQLFNEIKDSLLQALHSLSLSKDIRIILHSIGDFGYAWKILPQLFAPQMQQIIKKNPMRIHEIGATFLKLASAFDASLMRIQQVNSKLDLVSVSNYYSSKLMSHIRDVLHVIPETILELLSSIIEIQTQCNMGELPSRISLDKLRDYALPEKRFKMLELIYKVSHYAESLILMQNTIIGVIEVDSRKLLEGGIRRELVRRMSDSIHKILYPPSKLTSERKHLSGKHLAISLLSRLVKLDEVMGGFKRSLEYVQDYLFIYGLKMWQEELGRIVRFNVDMATSALRGKSYLNNNNNPHHHHHQQQVDNQSSTQSASQQQQHQSGKIPVPVYHSNPLKSSFFVLILDELLQITDPRSSIYDEQMSAWLTINNNNTNSNKQQQQTHDRLLDLKVFQLIGSSLGIVGLNGFDELCSCLLMFELQRLDDLLISIFCNGQDSHFFLESLDALAKLPTNYVTTASSSGGGDGGGNSSSSSRQIYGNMLKLMAPHSERIISHLSSIGQLQLIRMSISSVLSTRSRCEARNIYNCLETLNSSLLATLKQQQSGRFLASSSSPSPPSLSQHNQSNNSSKEQEQQSTTDIGNNNNQVAKSTDIGINSNQNEERDLCDHRLLNSSSNNNNNNNNEDDNDMIDGDSFGRRQAAAVDLDDSQLIFELTNHLEWIGLSEPLSKIYTLSLQSSDSSQIYEFRQKFLAIDLIKFLLLLEHCSSGTKFLFSKSISDFLPVPNSAVDNKTTAEEEMAQLNPNFEIDFSDINSYEQIQLINDTQLAKENLLMHRAYQEPSDDEIIRNHFSSFTFVDFCPKLFTIKQPFKLQQQQQSESSSRRCPGPVRNAPSASASAANATTDHPTLSSSTSSSSIVKYYELETFSDLFERINKWLKLNKDWRVVSMETLVFDCKSHFNYLKSSIHSNYLPQNTRGLRLYLSPSKSRFTGPQKIGCINVVPRKLSGSHTNPNEQPVVYETLQDILNRLNELLLSRPIEGRILSVETITLPMSNGFVNTESNYFMDSRLNLLNQSTYNSSGCCFGQNSSNYHYQQQQQQQQSSLSTTTTTTTNNGQQQFASNPNDPTQNGHCLIDILRVYYEFGPMVGGLVNLIDFIPRFYSSTPTGTTTATGHDETQAINDPSNNNTQQQQQQQVPKEAATESLTRLIRRSLAWFETERKRVLNETSQPNISANNSDEQSSSSSLSLSSSSRLAEKSLVNLKVCNLQVHHKTLLKHQLLNVNFSNVIDSLNTSSMLHEPMRSRAPIICGLCNISTGLIDPQDWCSHLVEQTQIYQLRFVRLAYVVPVYNKYAKSIYPMRSLRMKQPIGSSANQSAAPSTSSSSSSSSSNSTSSSASASASASASPAPSSDSSSSSSSSTKSHAAANGETSDLPKQQIIDGQQQQTELQDIDDHEREVAKEIDPAIVKDILNSGQQEEWMKQFALSIVSNTNERHRQDEEAHQLAGTDSALNDAPIGQLTYRLFAPCQLVKSSSCFSINPVNSSSPLSRRGSVDLNGSGRISSDDAHPSTSSLHSAGHSQTNLVDQSTGSSSSPFFPNLNMHTSDFLAAATGPLTDGSLFGYHHHHQHQHHHHYQQQQQQQLQQQQQQQQQQETSNNSSSSKYFASNEFELVDAIKRRMEVYVTTNSMKVIAGETLIINLSDSLSCLSTAIEQTVIKAPSIRTRSSTWVCVYVLYAAVDEPHLQSQLLAYQQQQQKLGSRQLEHIDEEEHSNEGDKEGGDATRKDDIPPEEIEPHFDDDFKCDVDSKQKDKQNQVTREEEALQQQLAAEEQEQTEEDLIAECNSAANIIYNSAYDRTVALPTSPDNSDTTNRPLEPIEVLGSQVADYLWLDEVDLADIQQQRYNETFKYSTSRRRSSKSGKKRKSKSNKKLHEHDSQCSLI